MEIVRARSCDIQPVFRLALGLWPRPEPEQQELRRELEQLLCSEQAAVFLARIDGKNVGFAQCRLRHDDVEGAASSPAGYLEGLYVDAAYRGSGIGRRLTEECAGWAKAVGCTEFTSDWELKNTSSSFHLKLGFREANRIICFVKEL